MSERWMERELFPINQAMNRPFIQETNEAADGSCAIDAEDPDAGSH